VLLLEFDILHDYGTDKESIEISVTLRFGERTVSFPAQLDTGATFCVFERSYAQTLGLSVQSGMPIRFSTAMGSFHA
jgi:predicted aspartyl protease